MPPGDNASPYASALDDFLRPALRFLKGHGSEYKLPFTQVQGDAGLSFFDTLVRGVDDHIKLLGLHKFMVTLLEAQPELEDVEGWTCPFRSFYAAKALRDDGNFIPPETFTGYLGKGKYMCNITAIFDADLKRLDHPRGMIG